MKFVIIGSGSQFTEFFLQELFKYEEFKGSTLSLVDRRASRLKHELQIANVLNEAVGWDVKIEGYTDRIEALNGADMVYAFFAVNQKEAWAKEFELSNKYGIYPLEGITAGPASLGMSIRHVPVMLDLCSDIERICPNAWLVMDNNPLSKLAAAVERHANVKYVGYCNGHELIQTAIEQLLELTDRDESQLSADPVQREFMVPAGNVELTLAGVNHLSWILEARSVGTGEDLYPELRRRIEKPELIPVGFRYSAEVCKMLGLFPAPADGHVGDYLWFTDKPAQEAWGMSAYPMEQWFGNRDADAWEKIAAEIDSKDKAVEFISRRRTGWYNVQIARIMLSGKYTYFPAMNVINNSAISNLPPDIIVEVPGIIGPDSVKALQVGALPERIAPYCSLIGSHNNLIADAAATGSREKALQALLLDPLIHSLGKAEKLLDDILEYNSKYDTRF